MMRLSVVTPVLNGAAYIGACLDSVAVQGDVEHIVMDGGSTDGTLEVLEQRGVAFRSEPDNGQPDALRKGFEVATGDVLCWLNADDRLMPGACDAVLSVLRDNRPTGLVLGWCRYVADDGTILWKPRPPRHLSLRSLVPDNRIFQPATFFTRAAYDETGGVDPAFH